AMRVKHPAINPNPITINPHIFKKSIIPKAVEFATIDVARPENIPFVSRRNPAEDQ
ncbi:unnamed protein product, partial [marine sediment metagenome]